MVSWWFHVVTRWSAGKCEIGVLPLDRAIRLGSEKIAIYAHSSASRDTKVKRQNLPAGGPLHRFTSRFTVHIHRIQ